MILPHTVHLPVTKPTSPNALVLEAWAQGYLVGSLIIMAAITIANMRRGVLLHKLILLEVRYHCIHLRHLKPDIIPSLAFSRHFPRHIHLQPRSCLRLVFVNNRDPSQYFLVSAQRHLMDEDEAISHEEVVILLHRHGHPGATILGCGNICQFHLFQ